MVLVISDAGHGGIDGGASAKGLVEKNLTLEASNYVHARLNELGLKSIVTRSTDVPLKKGKDNIERTNKVKNSGADVCLCHHYNAGGGNGAEMIVSKHSDKKLATMIIEEMKAVGHAIRPKSVFTRTSDDGSDYYYMHRMTGNVQTVIIEYDFLDNRTNDLIKDKAYREKLYEAVVKATCKYFKITYKSKTHTGTNTNTTTEKNTIDSTKKYRVIAGSFMKKENAMAHLRVLKELGIESFVEER